MHVAVWVLHSNAFIFSRELLNDRYPHCQAYASFVYSAIMKIMLTDFIIILQIALAKEHCYESNTSV